MVYGHRQSQKKRYEVSYEKTQPYIFRELRLVWFGSVWGGILVLPGPGFFD